MKDKTLHCNLNFNQRKSDVVTTHVTSPHLPCSPMWLIESWYKLEGWSKHLKYESKQKNLPLSFSIDVWEFKLWDKRDKYIFITKNEIMIIKNDYNELQT